MSLHIHRKTCNQEDDKRDTECRHRGIEHITNMCKQRCTRNARCQHRGIAQRRELVTKISPRNDGACNPSVIETMRFTDSHQCQTNRGYRGPRRTNHQTHQCAQDTTANKEYLWPDDLHTIINHGGHDARHHPRAANGTNQ